MSDTARKHISIHAFCKNPIEKDIGGKRQRFISGVASGLKEDAHGEHVTERCIQSLAAQAGKTDVLLYADVHGIKESEDIGIMTDFRVEANGDWWVEFRLYDENDAVDAESRDKAQKLWAQVNGLPPYTKPRQKGFSIEGYIPDNAILENKKNMQGIIDDMILEGVIITPQPAYKDSVIHAIYKALDITPEWKAGAEIRKSLREARRGRRLTLEMERFLVDVAFQGEVNKALMAGESVEEVFDEHKNITLEIIQGRSLRPYTADVTASPYHVQKSERTEQLLKIQSELLRLQGIRSTNNG